MYNVRKSNVQNPRVGLYRSHSSRYCIVCYWEILGSCLFTVSSNEILQVRNGFYKCIDVIWQCPKCVCMCIVWQVELRYLTRFLQISCSTDCVFIIWKDFTPSVPGVLNVFLFVCLCVCSCVMCEFLQGRCSRHVTRMGVCHHGGSDIAEWVNTKYRLIRFSLTQPVRTSTFSFQFVYIVVLFNHNSAMSVSCQLLQWWLYSTQPLDQVSMWLNLWKQQQSHAWLSWMHRSYLCCLGIGF